MWAWPGSRDHDNCTVQTAAMGQIPRSTERILVLYIKRDCRPFVGLSQVFEKMKAAHWLRKIHILS